jgi:hypothetical protein
MKIEKANNLEVNFLSKARVDDLDKLDRKKLWLMEADAVVETWFSSDNETVVRRYASGWLEIRGCLTSSGSGTKTATFPFPFSNTKYAVVFTPMSTSSTIVDITLISAATTEFTSYVSGSGSTGFIWFACGMGTN